MSARRMGAAFARGSGLVCAWHEVRLCWVREKGEQGKQGRPGKQGTQGKQAYYALSSPGPRRQGIKLHRHTGPVTSDDDSMKALATLDATAPPTRTGPETIGPFAIFRVEGFRPADEAEEDKDDDA
jgi:hypothetical protein